MSRSSSARKGYDAYRHRTAALFGVIQQSVKWLRDVGPPQFPRVHENDKRVVPADCDTTDALGCHTFEKIVEFFWDIMPCASSERPVRLVQHCDVARRIGNEGEELHRVIRQA